MSTISLAADTYRAAVPALTLPAVPERADAERAASAATRLRSVYLTDEDREGMAYWLTYHAEALNDVEHSGDVRSLGIAAEWLDEAQRLADAAETPAERDSVFDALAVAERWTERAERNAD